MFGSENNVLFIPDEPFEYYEQKVACQNIAPDDLVLVKDTSLQFGQERTCFRVTSVRPGSNAEGNFLHDDRIFYVTTDKSVPTFVSRSNCVASVDEIHCVLSSNPDEQLYFLIERRWSNAVELVPSLTSAHGDVEEAHGPELSTTRQKSLELDAATEASEAHLASDGTTTGGASPVDETWRSWFARKIWNSWFGSTEVIAVSTTVLDSTPFGMALKDDKDEETPWGGKAVYVHAVISGSIAQVCIQVWAL